MTRAFLPKLLQLFKRSTKSTTSDPAPVINALSEQLSILRAREAKASGDFLERMGELAEAVHMAGSGPWRVSSRVIHESNRLMESAIDAWEDRGTRVRARETDGNSMSAGAYGDIELALQNVEWRRQINLSWMEFSRWGIQQLILISRLYYLKNPICRRLVDVVAAYVFARGVEVTTNDDAANEVWEDFLRRNQRTFGHVALCAAERGKDTDGNLFWVLFSDRQDKGLVNARVIDPTEIIDILNDPEDSDTPWYYRREWDQQTFDQNSGDKGFTHEIRYYPAMGYDPAAKPATIGKYPVMWDQPVYHRKCGAVAKWNFGCPRIYPMLDWAREARKFLEACASVRQSLSQIALTLTTKGGQQAMEGAKQQLSTTIGPSSSAWDQNPPAVKGATFASGPGTKLEAFKTTGAGFSPEDVRQYKLMCCMVSGVPETFLGDVSTGNLATATSLDRPTETVFLEKQEAWVEDLTAICAYVLSVSSGAPSGRLKESHRETLRVTECQRKTLPNGRRVYEALSDPLESGKIEIQVNFPAIREGDVPALITATVEAMTLGSRGQVLGIDEKVGVTKLYDLLGIEGGVELAEDQYPDGDYDPDRSQQEIAAPVSKALPGGDPQVQNEAKLKQVAQRLIKAIDAYEAANGKNGAR